MNALEVQRHIRKDHPVPSRSNKVIDTRYHSTRTSPSLKVKELQPAYPQEYAGELEVDDEASELYKPSLLRRKQEES